MTSLTKPQKRALAKIAAGHVRWSQARRCYTQVRRDVLVRLVDMGLVERFGYAAAPVLTDRGREVLRNA
jgi:ribosomal protein S19E (S16A)